MEQLLIGRLLAERYRVEEVLGRGGMSVVYRAMDTRLGRQIALKLVAFPPDMEEADRQILRDRLRREAAAAACLSSHPNVVQVYDHGTDDALDLDFITMELLIGEDLKQIMGRGDADPAESIEILRAAIRGVAAGHRAGIVHRDVKPANIFLTRGAGSRATKVLDFGIAKALDPSAADDLTQHDHTPHSPAYASPEQLSMTGQSFASDVYQLGLVGYELLAGQRAFTADERQRIALGERVSLPAGERWEAIPMPIREIIEIALAPDPAQRFRDAIEFADALERVAGDDMTVALPGRPVGVRERTFALDEQLRAAGQADRSSETDSVPMAAGAGFGSQALGSEVEGHTVRGPDGPEMSSREHFGSGAPTNRVPAPGSGRRRPWGLYAAGAVLLLMIAWLLNRDPATMPVAGTDSTVETEAGPALSNIEVQDAEMRPLMLEAYENLSEGLPDP